MRAALWTVLVVAMASVAAAQRPVPQPPPPQGPAPQSGVRSTEVPVVIEGCIRGRRLQLAYKGAYQGVHEEVLRASELLLEGSRELMQTLASDHDGHQEEVTGIAIIPPAPGGETVDTRTRTFGGARVFGGVRQTGRRGIPAAVAPADAPRPVRIRVQSVRHVADKCVPRR